jgi:glutaredoxin
MKKLIAGCVLMFSLSPLAALAAVTVLECVDDAGNSSFRDKCPPGSTKAGDKVFLGVSSKKAKSAKEIAAENPVVVYSIPNCDPCDLVRNVLNTRGVPFSEKNIQDDAALQTELKAKTGDLTVPSVLVGATVLTGYNRAALESALNQASYPAPAADAPAAAAPPQAE